MRRIRGKTDRAGHAKYRFILAAVVYTYRSVIDYTDVHHSLEHAVFDPVFAI